MPVTAVDESRWEKARLQMVVRWREILQRIQTREEGEVLGLVNAMDEFCEEALHARDAAGEKRAVRCVFCRGFLEHGGCFGLLRDVNRAVLNGRWEAARCLAEAHLGRLETADFSDEGNRRVEEVWRP